MAQVHCRLSRGKLALDAQLQVQKGAPVDLLLGMDTLAHLGLSLMDKQDQAEDEVLQGDAVV